MPETVRGRTGNGSGEGVEEGAVMSEKQKFENEKQKVPDDQEKKSRENTAYQESKGQKGILIKIKVDFFRCVQVY